MKYVPGPFVGQLSRSQGNTTASHNAVGSYLRNRVIPVNPNTALQTIQRNNLGELSGAYKSLAEAQRSAWSVLGDQMSRLDSLGVTYTLSGLQAYISVNRVRRLFGLADLDDAPALIDPGVLTTLSAAYEIGAPNTFLWTFTPTPLGVGFRLVYEATRPVSAGINFMPRSEYKALFYSGDSEGSGGDVRSQYEAIFGVPTAGQKIFIRGRVVASANFQGVPINAQLIVTAG